ncbi:MAG: PQQ-dependent dehydrogenase, methanol/ethanol family [Candidatus Eremiobacteraeota bacterium]|nr:PQQ-dependent dehydrogenase, methanol/ethanol family [Candidatus Eremiobacteraeota bacterium]MBV8499634.1 PQQ-dependent dehydrogenase, methanol/ethanol family [Candidatus Eremiobacteraeota bacterium]
MRPALCLLGLLVTTSCSGGGAAWQPVTDARLKDAASDDGWLMYLRTYDAHAHAPFDQINARNVARLHVVFTRSFSIPEGYEAPPIVNGRTMIATTPLDRVYAMDAVTGKPLWEYSRNIPKVALRTVCCDMVNRGVALYGNDAYLATLDAHVVAIDARSGKVDWDRALAAPGIGYAMTAAPLAVHGSIIAGVSCGEYGARGFLEALDAATGAQRWRFYTVPSPSEPGGKTWPGATYRHGGACPWMTPSYDAATNTIYVGTSNPSPWLWLEHPGQNLYTDSILALDADTGRLKWYFQQTPNDPWDYDATATPLLANLTIGGKPRPVLFQAARNGWLYLIDRRDGSLIYMKRYTMATSVTGYDRSRRIGTVDAALKPQIGQAIFTCPAFFGADNWWAFALDPAAHDVFVPTMHTCMKLSGQKPPKLFHPGAGALDEGFAVMPMPGAYGWGALQAFDLRTGARVWTKETKYPWTDGTLSTGGGLVFSGTPDRKFYALDSRTGRPLWTFVAHSGFVGQPVTYRVDGKQYVAVQNGYGGVTPFWGGKKVAPMFRRIPLGGTLYVFSL